MEIESQLNYHHQGEEQPKTMKKLILILNCALLSIGNVGGPLIIRLYFYHGGKRVWLSCWLETCGFPIMLIPLLISYFYRKSNTKNPIKLFSITPFLVFSGAILGILTGLDDYMYADGVSKLPTSTSALIIATQLVFTAGFAFFIVKQRITAFSLNAIILLTVGAVVLGVHTSSDRPEGESEGEYLSGFFMTLGAAALYGFILPMVEWSYRKTKSKVTYTVVIEMQMIMSFFATGVCTIGMLISKDFQAIPNEAKSYGLGEGTYYTVLILNAIIWQLFFLGAIGVIFSASSLLSGIIIAVLLPLTETLAVAFYHEKFTAEKGISLALSLWGFVSYFYGEIKHTKKLKKTISNNSNVEE